MKNKQTIILENLMEWGIRLNCDLDAILDSWNESPDKARKLYLEAFKLRVAQKVMLPWVSTPKRTHDDDEPKDWRGRRKSDSDSDLYEGDDE